MSRLLPDHRCLDRIFPYRRFPSLMRSRHHVLRAHLDDGKNHLHRKRHRDTAGVSPQTIGVLWSLSVAAEVVVFFVLGPWLLRRLTPVGSAGCHGGRSAMAGRSVHHRHRRIVADSAAARRDLCPAASRLHAPAGAECSGCPRRDGPGHLRHGRRRRGDGPPYASLRMALRPPGSGSLWHHGCTVPRGLADRALIETGARGHIPLTRPSSR
jgi:hypothetical protein